MVGGSQLLLVGLWESVNDKALSYGPASKKRTEKRWVFVRGFWTRKELVNLNPPVDANAPPSPAL